MPESKAIIKEARPLAVLTVLLLPLILFCGCASNMTGYYDDLRAKTDLGDYQKAAEFVDKSKGKYGKKNILMYYLDSGMLNHIAEDYKTSTASFEKAKQKYYEYYQKSISAGAASMVVNDNSLPYYGKTFERVHINTFEALNYLKLAEDNDAVVEARQADTLFKTFAVEKNNKNYYKDDGFIRYFMGLVYENGGYLNDANLSYYLALKAYKKGIAGILPPEELINDAYTTALALGMDERAAEIKKSYPAAKITNIPSGCGEVIILDYNGYVPKKIDNVLEFALFDIWPYVNQAEVDTKEKEDFEKAKSIAISAFSGDYVKVAFPKYQRIPNRIFTFRASADNTMIKAYKVQDFAATAEKYLEDEIAKIYVKTLARAAVKYAIGKTTSKVIDDTTNKSGLGALTQIGFNVFNSVTATADKRGWRTLPENILMARMYLPEGENTIIIDYLGVSGEIVESKEISVLVESGKKTFKILRSAK